MLWAYLFERIRDIRQGQDSRPMRDALDKFECTATKGLCTVTRVIVDTFWIEFRWNASPTLLPRRISIRIIRSKGKLAARIVQEKAEEECYGISLLMLPTKGAFGSASTFGLIKPKEGPSAMRNNLRM